MSDEYNYNEIHNVPNSIRKKKENIRIFIQRKRLASGILHKSISSQFNSMEKLISFVEKQLNSNKKKSQNDKNTIVINYKPVFVNSRQKKPTKSKPIPTPAHSPTHTNRRYSITPTSNSDNLSYTSKSNRTINRQSVSFDVPDVEDPFMFIEMMYQQLFTEDGQLRNGTETKDLADCVKQIVTHSRRNSMVRRDSIASNIHQQKLSSPSFHNSILSKATSLSSSPRFIPNAFYEEEEEGSNTLLSKNRIFDTSRRSSKRSSLDNLVHHQQQLHAIFNSYYHHQKRTSTTQTTMNPNYPFSIDDTDNEDLDTFSDLNSYRKTIYTPPPTNIDDDIGQTESKLLSSSGYQSLKSHEPIISEIHTQNDHYYCPNCVHKSQITKISPTSSVNIIQPIRDTFMKYLNFILISKNILIIPLFIFLLRQRSMYIGN